MRAELGKARWRGEHVALGTNTDPYQWVESRYKLMPGIWEAMRDYANPCSVLTKSPLLLRDLGLFKQIAARTEFVANLSVPTLDEKAWRASEPHTPHPKTRLAAVGELTRAGIPSGILIAPLMPGINDDPRQVEKILEVAGEMGATNVGGIGLHLRGEVKALFMDWLRQYRPDLVPRYERLYGRGAAPTCRRRSATAWPSWREARTHRGGSFGSGLGTSRLSQSRFSSASTVSALESITLICVTRCCVPLIEASHACHYADLRYASSRNQAPEPVQLRHSRAG